MKSQKYGFKITGIICLYFIIILSGLYPGRLCAQDAATQTEADYKATISRLQTQVKKYNNPSHQPKILDFRYAQIAPTEGQPVKKQDSIMAGNVVSIQISHPKEFLLERPTDKTPLILYANGFPLTGMSTDYFTQLRKADLEDSTKLMLHGAMWIHFIFKRDSTTKEAWQTLYRLANWDEHAITINLSLGWAGMFPLESANNADVNAQSNVKVFFYQNWIFAGLFIGYMLFILFFIYLCHSTGLIRDPDTLSGQNNINGPFSLSQTQLAFWTVIIIGGFMYLVLLTGLADCINSSILLLLGISGGTTGAASFIDYYKRQPGNQNSKPVIPKKHRNFLFDILSDGVNVSMQRAQTILWNLVLGGYFFWYVITNKSMPVFNNTLLVLAGVSSVLYLGSKGPENAAPGKPAAPPQE